MNQVGVSVPDTCHLYGLPRSCIKKAEHQRIDAFELWCWGRLESPLDCKEIQSALSVHWKN